MQQMTDRSRHVVVTGAAGGIGRTTASFLAEKGFHVFAGVRKQADVDSLREAGIPGVEPLILEVTEADSIQAAAEQLSAALGSQPLHAIVNNAGVTVTCPLEFVDVDAMRWQFEVNLFGVAAVTRAFLPLLRRPGGRVVNVSSGAGQIALPLIGPYVASKFALEGMSDVLRLELRHQGIGVSVIVPGVIQSGMHDKNRAATQSLLDSLPPEGLEKYGAAIERLRENDARDSAKSAPATEVAEAIHRALTARRPRTRYPVTKEVKLLSWVGAFLGDRARDAIMGRMVGL